MGTDKVDSLHWDKHRFLLIDTDIKRGDERAKNANGFVSSVQEVATRSQSSRYRKMEYPTRRNCAATTANTFMKTLGTIAMLKGRTLNRYWLVPAHKQRNLQLARSMSTQKSMHLLRQKLRTRLLEKGGNNRIEHHHVELHLSDQDVENMEIEYRVEPSTLLWDEKVESR